MGDFLKWLVLGYAAVFVGELMWVGYHYTRYIQELREIVRGKDGEE